MPDPDPTASFVAVDRGGVRWLGSPLGVAAWAAELGADSLVVWRVDTAVGHCERILVQRTVTGDPWSLIGEDGRILAEVEDETGVEPIALAIIDAMATMRPVVMTRTRPSMWPSTGDSSFPLARWGFGEPRLLDAAGVWVAGFCPEVIASHAVTANIGGQDLSRYLVACYARLVHWCLQPVNIDDFERERRVDEILDLLDANLMRMIARVQLAVLDRETA